MMYARLYVALLVAAALLFVSSFVLERWQAAQTPEPEPEPVIFEPHWPEVDDSEAWREE